jgi:hypothetical protein
MSDTKTEISAESLKKIGGGECTAQEYITIVGQLTDAYESLVDFTSYVMGRISGDPPTQP